MLHHSLTSSDSLAPPPGFTRASDKSNFNALCGPYYEKEEDGVSLCLAIHIESKHLNQQNMGHGGMLMSLADNTMGDAARHCYPAPIQVVTVSLNAEFMRPAQLGDWVIARAYVRRTGHSLSFVDCVLSVGDTAIFKASAVFSVVHSTRPDTIAAN